MGNCHCTQKSIINSVAVPENDLNGGVFQYNKVSKKIVYLGEHAERNLGAASTAITTISSSTSDNESESHATDSQDHLDNESNISLSQNIVNSRNLLGEIAEYLDEDDSTYAESITNITPTSLKKYMDQGRAVSPLFFDDDDIQHLRSPFYDNKTQENEKTRYEHSFGIQFDDTKPTCDKGTNVLILERPCVSNRDVDDDRSNETSLLGIRHILSEDITEYSSMNTDRKNSERLDNIAPAEVHQDDSKDISFGSFISAPMIDEKVSRDSDKNDEENIMLAQKNHVQVFTSDQQTDDVTKNTSILSNSVKLISEESTELCSLNTHFTKDIYINEPSSKRPTKMKNNISMEDCSIEADLSYDSADISLDLGTRIQDESNDAELSFESKENTLIYAERANVDSNDIEVNQMRNDSYSILDKNNCTKETSPLPSPVGCDKEHSININIDLADNLFQTKDVNNLEKKATKQLRHNDESDKDDLVDNINDPDENKFEKLGENSCILIEENENNQHDLEFMRAVSRVPSTPMKEIKVFDNTSIVSTKTPVQNFLHIETTRSPHQSKSNMTSSRTSVHHQRVSDNASIDSVASKKSVQTATSTYSMSIPPRLMNRRAPTPTKSSLLRQAVNNPNIDTTEVLNMYSTRSAVTPLSISPKSLPWDECGSDCSSTSNWSNPEFIKEGRKAAHTRIKAYRSSEKQKEGASSESTFSSKFSSPELIKESRKSAKARIKVFKSNEKPKECISKWNPSIFQNKDGCIRCLALASKREIQQYLTQGRHSRIVMTSGGCCKDCNRTKKFMLNHPELQMEEEFHLCRLCFNALHR